jgi:hypothetical protein
MNETQLQIVISAVNNASEQLQGVSASLSEMASNAATAASDIDESFSATGSTIASDISSATSDAEASMAGLADTTATAAGEMESSVSSVGGKIQAVGIQLGILGAATLAPVVSSIGDAADKSSVLAQGLNQINNIIQGASGPTAENATQIASLTAKIEGYRASIASATAAMATHIGNTPKEIAEREKEAASIATATSNLQKYQNELAPLLAQHSLVGASAQNISDQFSGLATQNTNLGISFEDSYSALVSFFNQTKSTKDATAEYGAAVDLVASGKIPDMKTATQDVTQAFNGMGRSLQQVVPDMKAGVAGMDAIAQITAFLAGSPTIALQQYNTQMASLGTKTQELGAAMAAGLLPALTKFLETVNTIVDKVTAWAEAHPKLAEALLVFLGLLGGLLLLLGTILVPFGLLIIGIEAFNTALIALNLTMLGAIGFTFLYMAAFIAIVAVVALIIVYHKQILDTITYTWNAVVDYVSDKMLQLYDWVQKELANINKLWNDTWSGFLTFIENIWNTIGGAVQKGISYIEGILNGFANTVKSIYSTIMAPINAITGAVSSVSGMVSGAVGGTIKAFASGGIVTGPTLAMVGEAGPEAIIPLSAFAGGPSLAGAGGGASSINIYIQGGNYLDSGGATMIANAIGKQILQQLRLKNFN